MLVERKSRSARHDLVELNVATKKEEFLRLGYFKALQGTDYFLVSLSPLGEGGKFSSYSERWQDNARNYLLFHSKTKKSQWVWKNNSSYILAVTEVYNRVGQEKGRKVAGLFFELVDKDSNADGRHDYKDQRSLQYLDLTTSKVTHVFPAADRMIGIEQISPAEALIFYSMGGQSFFRSFSIDKLMATPAEKIAKVE